MSYEPTEWQSGDVVTSAALNKLEQGVAAAGGGVLVVHADIQTGALDKTVREIVAGLRNGGAMLVIDFLERDGILETYQIIRVEEYPDNYQIFFYTVDMGGDISTQTAHTQTLDLDEYPVFDTDG